MSNWLIQNAEIVNEGRRFHGDLRIRNGRIETLAGELSAQSGELIFDAQGRLLIPGMIDDQVHFREPGLTHKGDISSESQAAVAGGITSFMEMPNTKPPAITIESLENKFQLAEQRSFANYSFYLGATNDNLEEIKRLDPRIACGIKVFMGASTGNMLVDNPKKLEVILRDTPCLLATHCEDTPTIEANLLAERKIYGANLPIERHPYIRSREACLKSSMLAVGLARKYGSQLHVLHISTKDELSLFQPGVLKDKKITAETCVHFLHFDESDYPTHGNFIKCNPAIKSAADRAAIIAAVREGRIDVLATDHAPHTLQEKQQSYDQAPSGLPLVQFALQCALERYFDGDFTLELVVEKTSHAPATLFRIRERGYIREGFHADLTLVDLFTPETVKREAVLSRCGWSSFEGYTFRSTIAATWVNGYLVYRDNQLQSVPFGQRLEFDR